MTRNLAPLFTVAVLLYLCPSFTLAQTTHPAESAGIKSISGDISTSLTFANACGQSVKVYWIDYDGHRVLYNTLADGQDMTQQTYLTHPWLITDANDNAWYIYFADAQPRTVEIVVPKTPTTQP